MSRKSTSASVRLTVAIGALYRETQTMDVMGAEETLAKFSALNLLRTLLASPAMVERLATLMEETR